MGNSKIKYQTDSLNTSIVYTLDPDERLDTFTNGMLVNNNIKGILAQSYEINNNVCTLSYTVSRGIPLSTLIKQSLKKEVVLTILKNIADILVRTEEYMLDVDKILLDNEYIFVNTATLEAGMILVPTNKPYGKPFRAFIKNCIVTGVFDLSEDASYVMQINNFLNVKSNASVKEISGFLDGLLQNKAVGGIPAMPQVSNTASQTPQAVQQPAPQKPSLQKPAPAAKAPAKQEPAANKAQPELLPVGGASNNAQPQKKGLFGGMFEKKEKKPANPAPAGSFAGMQIPGMESSPAMAVPQPMQPAQSAQPVKQEKPQKPAKPQKPEKAPKLDKPKPFMKNDQPMPIPPSPQNIMPEPVPLAQAYQNFSEETQQVYDQSGGEGTVMMGQAVSSAGAVVGVLEHRNGSAVMIEKDCFFIGKGTNTSIVNDLVIRNENVSRNHAIIERSGGSFFVKDNNSTNGTYLNGKRITPNIRQELKNGDRVVFANEEYIFMIKRS